MYEIAQQIAAIQTAGQVYDGEEKALAGCIVAIGNGGLLQIEKGSCAPMTWPRCAACASPRPRRGQCGGSLYPAR
ncbi:hypothetical protein CDO25_11295 [Sinorhizobium meliloti]|nr:hypothetical protein CDO25_11295 [Sinorhizobium meliloti]